MKAFLRAFLARFGVLTMNRVIICAIAASILFPSIAEAKKRWHFSHYSHSAHRSYYKWR